MQVTCIWEVMKVKEKKSPKELLVTEFLGKINPSGWRTNRKAALSELEYQILNNGEQVCCVLEVDFLLNILLSSFHFSLYILSHLPTQRFSLSYNTCRLNFQSPIWLNCYWLVTSIILKDYCVYVENILFPVFHSHLFISLPTSPPSKPNAHTSLTSPFTFMHAQTRNKQFSLVTLIFLSHPHLTTSSYPRHFILLYFFTLHLLIPKPTLYFFSRIVICIILLSALLRRLTYMPTEMMTPSLTRAAIIALKLLAKLLNPSIYPGTFQVPKRLFFLSHSSSPPSSHTRVQGQSICMNT